jgi:hypothetical protein
LEQALGGPDRGEWEAAIAKGLKAHETNGTWTAVDPPKDRRVIGSKLILKKKRGPQGEILSRKARLVAQGFTQRWGVDYAETFAPVSRGSTILTVLAVAAHRDMEVHQMDVDTAHLNATVSEDIYMAPPKHLRDRFPGKVLKLNKALYGLKQSGREWNKLLAKTLKDLGWTQSEEVDACLFTRDTGSGLEYLIVYVDDLILACPDTERMSAAKSQIAGHFQVKDLGELKYVLGVAVTRDKKQKTVRRCQAAYTTRMLERHSVPATARFRTPMEARAQPVKHDKQASPEDTTRCQEMVGSLMHLARFTRPDISTAVGVAARFASNPSPEHFDCSQGSLRTCRQPST